MAAGGGELESGDYDIPYQAVSCIMLGPGSTISHDALRLLARHGTGLVIVGSSGVRFYASMPAGPDASQLARDQVTLWADMGRRITVARRMYAMRMGELVPHAKLSVLRGIEGSRVRETYRIMAQQYGLEWGGRSYDRANPTSNDDVNMAINHASTAVVAAAQVAVASSGTIPQLGFIHESSGIAFPLDIADLYREEITLPCAFSSVNEARRTGKDLERLVRHAVGDTLHRGQVVAGMIDRIKELLSVDDGRSHA